MTTSCSVPIRSILSSLIVAGKTLAKLDVRLLAVGTQIRSKVHVDIGSDAADLLVWLLECGRIEFGIAVENKRRPLDNSSRALAGFSAEARFGDGLAVIGPDETDSLSICGMGAERIVQILEARPESVPKRVVLQPNQQPELIRSWGLRSGYHLVDEQIVRGTRIRSVISFQRVGASELGASELGALVGEVWDPAYEKVDFEAALLFGPLVIKRGGEEFLGQLKEEDRYWSRFDRLEPRQVERMEIIKELLGNQVNRPG